MDYTIDVLPKQLRETLCVAQSAINEVVRSNPRKFGRTLGHYHIATLQTLINECDRHRPLGSDGKHGNRHTATCGCEDIPEGIELWDVNRNSYVPSGCMCRGGPHGGYTCPPCR